MNQSQSQINSLLVIVALLAVVGGLITVIVMSPQSWEMGPAAWLQGPPPTLTPVPPSATPAPTETSTATALVPPATASPTLAASATESRATATPTVDPAVTVTEQVATTTSTPTVGAVVTSNSLPDDVQALAVVTLTAGATSGRLRDAPNGETIITAVPNGTNVEVLFARVEAGGNMWVTVRLGDGTEGWMAEFLLRYTVTRP
jgi:hypothetical protein